MTTEQAQLFVQECKMQSGSQFVFIPGFEVPYKNAHILLIGTESFISQKADAETLKAWSLRSELTILAHPVRNSFLLDSTMEEVLDGIEIWNQQYEGKRVPRPRSVRLFEDLRKKNQALMATAGLDFHRKEHFGAPCYSIETDMLTKEAILSALTEGRYTFGTKRVEVAPSGLWKGKGSISHILQSALSVLLIFSGKRVNALLAFFGLKLPSGLKRLIRSRV